MKKKPALIKCLAMTLAFIMIFTYAPAGTVPVKASALTQTAEASADLVAEDSVHDAVGEEVSTADAGISRTSGSDTLESGKQAAASSDAESGNAESGDMETSDDKTENEAAENESALNKGETADAASEDQKIAGEESADEDAADEKTADEETAEEESTDAETADEKAENGDPEGLQSEYSVNGYSECYDSDGYSIVKLPLMQELYINLNQPLHYALYDPKGSFTGKDSEADPDDDPDAAISLAEAAADPDWSSLFTDDESDSNLYQQLKTLIDADQIGTDGFVPLTEDMIPILKKMALNRWKGSAGAAEYWDAFCYYKKAGENADTEDDSYTDDENVGKKILVYGNADLSDKDAYVLTLFGDGFDSEEQDDFYTAAADLADYMMQTEPFTELTAAIKIYAIGCISEDSGISNAEASRYANVGKEQYLKDTYFDSSYWSYGVKRMVCLSKEGTLKLAALSRKLVPDTDVNGIIVNSTVYGGAGGDYLTTSLNSSAREIFLHELGHACADLADEYYTDTLTVSANASRDSDPESVSWSDFIGVDGVGVYAYTDGPSDGVTWYRPSENCKMRYLGTAYPFCAVCQEELRKCICAASNVPILFWQPYAEYEFTADELTSYFILRQSGNENTLDQLDASKVHLTYADSKGKKLDGEPTATGLYTVTASYGGDTTYGAANRTIDAYIIVKTAEENADEETAAEETTDDADEKSTEEAEDTPSGSSDDSTNDPTGDKASEGEPAGSSASASSKSDTESEQNKTTADAAVSVSDGVKTGDATVLYLWMALAVAALAASGTLISKKRRNGSEK